jgi:hypothetical protein
VLIAPAALRDTARDLLSPGRTSASFEARLVLLGRPRDATSSGR